MLKRKSFIIFYLLLLSPINSTMAATFNCQKAKSHVEVVICNNQTLSILDDWLGQTYQNMLRVVPDRQGFINQQRVWLLIRDRYSNEKYLAKAYWYWLKYANGVADKLAVKPLWQTSYSCLDGSGQDILICQNPVLAASDIILNNLYQKSLKNATQEQTDKLVRQENIWLSQRQQCGEDNNCILKRYFSRIMAMSSTKLLDDDEYY